MSKINQIQLSGTTYDIEDSNANKTVTLTQAQYDALAVKDPNTYYIISDAQGGDLSNYYTKSEIDTRLSNLTLVQLTQSAYDALEAKDSSTLYIITED